MASISIIVPFRKGIHYLKDCFEGIEAQRLIDCEVLLIGDGVTEEISELLNEYQSRMNIRYELLKEGSGVAAARNLGLRLATCDYIYFLDSDDYLVDDVLQGMLTKACDSEAYLVYAPIVQTSFKRKSFLSEYKGNEEEQHNEYESVNMQRDNNAYGQEQSEGQQHSSGQKYSNDQKHVNMNNLLEHFYSREASVLNVLIDRNWLVQSGIIFEETLQFYSDMPFVTALICNAIRQSDENIDEPEKQELFESKEDKVNQSIEYDSKAIYAKRIHNDSIQYPSLSQIVSKDRPEDFLRAYQSSRSIVKNAYEKPKEANSIVHFQSEILEALEQSLYRYLINLYTGKYHSRNEKVLNEHQLTLVKQALSECKSDYVIKELMSDRNSSSRTTLVRSLFQTGKNTELRYEHLILTSLRNGNAKSALKYANRILIRRKRKGLFGNQVQRARAIDKLLFRRLSKKENWIVFESFLGASYSDSCKYIYEYLLKQYPGKFRYIWVVKDCKTQIPGNPRKVRPDTISYVYYMSRAKYWVNNMRQPIWLAKRPGTIFLETWHGTPLKKLVFDMEDIHSASPNYKSDFYMQSRKWDYLISDNPFSTKVFQSAFLFDRDMILEYGYPRNDILHAPDREEIANEIRRRLDLPQGKKIILYAPTWRDDEFYEPGKYKFNLALDLKRLKQELGKEYIVLLRTHYFIADNLNLEGVEDFAYNVSQYDDVSELYLITDICITDYSSVFFDYANLRRPILFFTYDLEKYKDVLRGFYIDMETEVPGPLLQTNDELIRAIRNINEVSESYASRYEEFYKRFCSLDDGNAAKRVVEKVFLK
ncbi:MAG TPA: bifunctional glycosyltransferase family 2 protein/CDP-glycerol:glycerophosphate glycerophosphotransferase [Lachnospiraceae bacterium]|nr:bifunctional glycosyltransferase family 2 protein/CDP-glycerol:glycerophosphate glycerophosphotransferase [Lachnospiraceae bacterium]